jgi:hypothetical protein
MPSAAGEMLYSDGYLYAKDAYGIFNLRSLDGVDDKKVKVSSNDTVANYLSSKLAGDGIAWTQVNDGGNEQFKATVTANSAYKFDINPSLLMTSGNANKVLANDYAAIEIQANQTAFGVWSGSWKRAPTSNVIFKIRFIMKSSGADSPYVRIALKIKARAVGEDSSTDFDYVSFVPVQINYTTLGQIFEGSFSVSNSLFAVGDSVSIHAGRDGHNDLGVGQSDTASKAIQIITIDVDIP